MPLSDYITNSFDLNNAFNAYNNIRKNRRIALFDSSDGNNFTSNAKINNVQDIINSANFLGVDPRVALATSMIENHVGSTYGSDERNDNKPDVLYHLNPKYNKDKTPFGNAYTGVEALKEQLKFGSNYQKQHPSKSGDEYLYQANMGYGKIKKGHRDLEGSNKIFGVQIPDQGIDFSKNPLYGKKIVSLIGDLNKNSSFINLLNSLQEKKWYE